MSTTTPRHFLTDLDLGAEEQAQVLARAAEMKARIASVAITGTVATARLEIDNWTGHRFTDLFTLLKVDGQWKIMNKVFHLHG